MIQSFYTQAQNRDFARLFQFRLRSFGNVIFNEGDYTYVETASLPGKTINNVQVPYMGLQFNVPGTVSYPGSSNYAVTFRCDQNYDLRAALEAAMTNTFNDATSKGQYFISPTSSILELELLNKQMKPIREYKLYGVYVQSLADTAYDIKDTGAISTINATIAYQFWRGRRPSSADLSTQTPFADIAATNSAPARNGR